IAPDSRFPAPAAQASSWVASAQNLSGPSAARLGRNRQKTRQFSAAFACSAAGAWPRSCRARTGWGGSLSEAGSEAVEPFVDAVQWDGAVADHQSRLRLAQGEV